jgi:predicted NAD/FAD-dependent oxidoreductase
MTEHQQVEDMVVVIGAGIAGLLAASSLQAAGRNVLVLEKGRGVGGRMATRRQEDVVFDHGAQFFTVREPRFEQWVARWRASGAVTEWCRGFAGEEGGEPRYRGTSGMTTAPKFLASGLDVRLEQRVTALARQGAGWRVMLAGGTTEDATAVILTAPLPQSLALLEAGGVQMPVEALRELGGVRYESCLAVLVTLDGSGAIPSPGAVRLREGPLSWLADNQVKGISGRPSVTLHASAAFSQARWNDDRDAIARDLLDAARPWLGSARVRSYQVHGWLYSRPVTIVPRPFLAVPEQSTLILAGDAFGGPSRVEGAALSGLSAAEYLLGRAV